MLIYSKKCQVLVHSLPRTGLEQEVVWGVVQEMEPRAGWSRPRQPPDSWEGKKSKDTQLQTQGVCVCVRMHHGPLRSGHPHVCPGTMLGKDIESRQAENPGTFANLKVCPGPAPTKNDTRTRHKWIPTKHFAEHGCRPHGESDVPLTTDVGYANCKGHLGILRQHTLLMGE